MGLPKSESNLQLAQQRPPAAVSTYLLLSPSILRSHSFHSRAQLGRDSREQLLLAEWEDFFLQVIHPIFLVISSTSWRLVRKTQSTVPHNKSRQTQEEMNKVYTTNCYDLCSSKNWLWLFCHATGSVVK